MAKQQRREHWGYFQTERGVVVECVRGSRNITTFFDFTGKQVGPTQVNVAPAFAYAQAMGWVEAEALTVEHARYLAGERDSNG